MRVAVGRLLSGLVVAAGVAGNASCADDPSSERLPGARPPVYQRQRSVEQTDRDRFGPPRSDAPYRRKLHSPPGTFFHRRPAPPLVSHGAWFQRPYPYHLDYYRLRYGGTYEPYYSGGLYGTPQVIVPPTYGYEYGYGYGSPYGYAPPHRSVPGSDAPPEDPADP